jgi:hypothetical protein
MGRPIKSKYFGIRKGTGVGGEGVSTITLSTTSLAVSTLSVTVVVGAPNIAGGTQATATAVKTGNTVTSVIVSEAGSGYLSAPAIAFTGTNMTTQGAATASLSSSIANVIACEARLTGGTQLAADIQEQVASKKYRVVNSDGTGPARLVTTSTLAEGQMLMLATDSTDNTYFVKKLTARRAVLVQCTETSTFEFDTNASVGWTLGAATVGSVVTIANR